jgi:hypothetical protein
MSRKPAVEATNEYLGHEAQGNIGEIGTGDIEVVDKPLSKKDIDMEAFMNEPVQIVVLSSQDPNESQLVLVAVNGVNQYIVRDQPIVVKRKYVERLARAKRTDYDQTLDERMGEAMNHLKQRHSLKYPFTVIQDANPVGPAWLRGILAERQ